MHDFEFVVDDQKLHVPQAHASGRRAGRAHVGERPADLVPPAHERRPAGRGRSTSARWDPKTKQPSVGRASAPRRRRRRRPASALATVASDLGGGTIVVADRVVTTSGEANEIAQSDARPAARTSFFEAEGVAFGNPRSRPAPQVKIDGVGSSSAARSRARPDHAHATAAAAATRPRFQISGRSARTLLDLIAPADERDWAASLVVGVVTNNNDPDGHGSRAREVPRARRRHEEPRGRGSRRPAPATTRGLLMLPQVDEEVDRRLRARRHAPPDRARLALQRQGQARRRPACRAGRRVRRSLVQREDPPALQEGLRDQVPTRSMVVEVNQDETHKVTGNYKTRRPATASSRRSSTRSRPARA